jgi:hypothetical protein
LQIYCIFAPNPVTSDFHQFAFSTETMVYSRSQTSPNSCNKSVAPLDAVDVSSDSEKPIQLEDDDGHDLTAPDAGQDASDSRPLERLSAFTRILHHLVDLARLSDADRRKLSTSRPRSIKMKPYPDSDELEISAARTIGKVVKALEQGVSVLATNGHLTYAKEEPAFRESQTVY